MVRQSPQRRSRALTQCSLATTTDPDAGRGSILSGWTIDARGRGLFGRFEGKPSVNLELRSTSVREARRRWSCQKIDMHRQVAYFPKVDADMTGSNRHLLVQACDVRPGIHNVDQREARPVSTFDPGLKLDRTRRGVVNVEATTSPTSTGKRQHHGHILHELGVAWADPGYRDGRLPIRAHTLPTPV